MVEIVNLTRLSGDGYLMNANNPLQINLSYITHAQLRYGTFTGSEAIQGTFVENSNSCVEFEVIGHSLIKPLKLYASTNGTSYTEIKTYGGADGIPLKECLVYSALLNQSSTNSPVPIELHNDFGITPEFTYGDVGTYIVTATGFLAQNKTLSFIHADGINSFLVTTVSFGIDNDTMQINTFNSSLSMRDDLLVYTPFKIEVYP